MPREHSPGFRFKDGKLYIFTEAAVYLLEGWPALRAVRKVEGEAWREFAPAFRVVRPYRPKKKPAPDAQLELNLGPIAALPPDSLAAQRKRAFDAFRFSLPRPVAARAEKFRSHQWALLRLFQARAETLEFAQQNPALCFALANFEAFDSFGRRRSLAEVVETSTQRQRDIAGVLGFPPTDGAARILAKLAPESASVEVLQPLRMALAQTEVAKTLAHLPRLNAGAVAIACDPQARAASTPKLLNEVAAVPTEKYRAATAELMRDTLRMFFAVHPRRGTPQFQSLARVRELHDEISTEYLRRQPTVAESFRFPRPPLRGTPEIVPIETLEELTAEGRQQNNCVATYAQRIQHRHTFIYRVLKPERATLSIVRGPDGDWEIDELERRENTGTSDATWRFVQAWLDEHALSA
jgi:hypothetical protein